MSPRPQVDLFGQNYGEDALFDLTPRVTKQLTRPASSTTRRQHPVHGTVACATQLDGDVIRLELPRWDTMWEVKKRRGGWPRIDPTTGKVLKHRKVWEVLRGNARPAHYAQRLHATREVIAAVVTAATAAGLKPCNHLTVQLVWSPGDNRRADEDNLVALQKVCCDALARGRSDIPGLQLVPDDTSRYMRKEMPRIARPPVPPGLWLEIQVA